MDPIVRFMVLIMLCLSPGGKLYAQQLTVGLTKTGNPPMSFPEKQQQSGIYQEILAAIGKHSGDTFVYKYFPPKRLLVAFERGSIDIEPGINPAWRENANIISLYSEDFAISQNIILFARNSKIPVTRPKDLINRRVGTIQGYYYPGYTGLFRTKRIIREDGDSELNLLQRMASGRFEQIFIQKDVAFYWMSRNRNFAEFEVGNANFTDHIMFRVHPTKERALKRMNLAIKQLKSDGTIEKIYGKYR